MGRYVRGGPFERGHLRGTLGLLIITPGGVSGRPASSAEMGLCGVTGHLGFSRTQRKLICVVIGQIELLPGCFRPVDQAPAPPQPRGPSFSLQWDRKYHIFCLCTLNELRF